MAKKTTKPDSSTATAQAPVPVVGLGASAGGLQAYSSLFDAARSDIGAAFVLVHHLDPDHKSLMADILGNHTKMPVVFAKDKTPVQADHVYVIPPGNYMTIKDGVLSLSQATEGLGARLPIDIFFRSLADDLGRNAIGIILSGTGGDGSTGILSIKDKGGIVLVQDPVESQHDGMPRSAMATGAVDHVVSVKKMPDIITRYIRHPFVQNSEGKEGLRETAKGALGQIFAVLKSHSSIHFDLYKEGTLLRRIERRMALRHMEDAADYVALLKDSPEELRHLSEDLLISVTSFFRDKEAFEYLEKTVLADLIKSHKSGTPIRIWVPACATGEEVYSLAMLAIEKISWLRKDVKLQIFASDVDERALKVARLGVYPDAITENVSAARLRRFFTKEDHSYRVKPELRDAVVFANQNVLSDAPFSKIDMISCRNLMIYLTPDAQERVTQMFHFALNDGGILFLGMSETTGSNDTLFQPVSKKFRVYKRVGHARSRAFDFTIAQRASSNSGNDIMPVRAHVAGNKLAELSQNLLMEHYAPAAVLINAQSEALYFVGPTDSYLRVPSGETSRDLLAMARSGLRARLSSAIRTARSDQTDVKETATITRDGDKVNVTVQVHPLIHNDINLFLVTFTDQPAMPVVQGVDHQNIEHNGLLERELESTRADLVNTVRDYTRTTEELKAVNEEAMSMNEEFQSTNEELETSKEELQSLNEELTTLNTQLQQKIDEERRMSDDLDNLLSSSGIATLFLDAEFKIMRFTPATRELFNLISKDVGRPFSDITGKIQDPALLLDAEKVLETLKAIDAEVSGENDQWFVRRVLPYRTQDGKISGVVVTYSDISDSKAMQRQNVAEREFAQSIVNTVREPLLVLDGALKIVSASQSFHRAFATAPDSIVGKSLFDIQEGQWEVPELRTLLQNILPEKSVVESFELSLKAADREEREMVLNARMIEDGRDLILLALEDVTEQKRAQQVILNREARLRAILDAAPEAIVTINESGIIDSFSPGAEALFGYSADEVLGQNVTILMPEPDKGRHADYLENYWKTGEKKVIGTGREMEACRKDGSAIPIRLAVSEFELDGEHYFLGIMYDLTADRKRQAELQRAQKMEAVGQLTGGLAHDFNNLLTVIIGNLELMEMRTGEKNLLELTHEALEAANLGATLTSQLLSFSKGQSLVPENVDLNALVGAMLPILKRTLDDRIQIETLLGDGLNGTVADPGQAESAILNLAFNARDAMPDGGTLTIETRNVTLDADFAATQIDVAPGDYVCLAITDTGTGMNPDIQSHAFEPFFTTKGPTSGSGLGLSMVYGFAKQSGGHVAIYSEEGQGTTVNLFLPKAKTTGNGSKVAPAEHANTAHGETILVVEDDPKVRRLTVTRLKELDYKVVSASDGPTAMEILKNDKSIDLVLTDVVMPGGMSGFDVMEKALDMRPELKVLLSTGYAKGVKRPDAKTSQAEHHILRKPYGLQELARTLREALD